MKSTNMKALLTQKDETQVSRLEFQEDHKQRNKEGEATRCTMIWTIKSSNKRNKM